MTLGYVRENTNTHIEKMLCPKSGGACLIVFGNVWRQKQDIWTTARRKLLPVEKLAISLHHNVVEHCRRRRLYQKPSLKAALPMGQ